MASTTAYASVTTSTGGELLWYAASSSGIHETINGWLGQFVNTNIEPIVGAGLVQYDNAPAISAGESVHALCEVRFESTEHVGGSDRNHYRKTGSLDLTLRGPVGLGDDPLLDMAELIRAQVQGVTAPVNVHLRAPSAIQLGRSGGWFEVGLSCPWWYDERAHRTATSGSSVNGDWADTADTIRGRFRTLVETPNSLPVTYDDVLDAIPRVRAVLAGRARRVEGARAALARRAR